MTIRTSDICAQGFCPAPPLSGRPAFWGQPKFVGHRCSISLYMKTTCKRISHKLLRNVVNFFDIIVNHDMGSEGFRVIQHTHTNEFMEPNENELSLALLWKSPSRGPVVMRYPSRSARCERHVYRKVSESTAGSRAVSRITPGG